MLIRKCITSIPRLFQNKAFTFSDGLNVIVGKNASGKSLLSRAITDLAWCNFNVKPLLEKSSWDAMYMEIHIETPRHRYHVTRNGEKLLSVRHFDGERVDPLFEGIPTDENLAAAGNLFLSSIKNKSIDRETCDLLSRIDNESYYTLSFMSAPGEVSVNGSMDYHVLHRLFLDDGTGFYSLFRSLKDGFSHDSPGKGVSGSILTALLSLEGRAKEIEKKIELLEIQKSKKDKLLRELDETGAEIDRLEREEEEITREAAEIQGILKKMEAIRTTGDKIAEIDAELVRYDEMTGKIMEKEAMIETKFTQFRDFNEHKKANLRKLQEVYRRIRDIHATMDECLFSRELKKKKIHYAAFFIFIIYLGIMYVINLAKIPLFASAARSTINLTLTGGAGMSILLLYVSLLLPGSGKQIEQLGGERESAHQELHRILQENGISLEDNRLESVYEFLLQYFEEYGEYTEKQLELFVLRETLKSGEQLKALRDEKRRLSIELRKLRLEVQNSLTPLKHLAVKNGDEEELRRQIPHAEVLKLKAHEERETRKKIQKQIRDDISSTADHDGEYRELLHEKNLTAERLKALKAQKDSALFILDIFNKVVERRESSQFNRLLSMSRDIFNLITAHQYVATMDESVIKKVILREGIPEELTASIIHTVIMSIKIALTEFIDELNLSFPLVLDDPFIFLDDNRGRILLDLLRETARKRQVLLFARKSPYLEKEALLEL